MRVPNVNVVTAVRMYYEKPELCNADIKELFDNKIGGTLLQTLKKKALKVSAEQNKPLFNSRCVNTECAYLAWGLSIEDLEHRYNKLKKLGLLEKQNV